MDINEIRDRFHAGYYDCKIDIPQKLPDNYVFDENLSVKRNREMVLEHNQTVENLKRSRVQKQAELEKQQRDDVVGYLLLNYFFNEKQARIVESYTYAQYHYCIYEYLSNIDDVAQFAEKLISERDNK